jgi:hypothetical protein
MAELKLGTPKGKRERFNLGLGAKRSGLTKERTIRSVPTPEPIVRVTGDQQFL